MLKKIAQLEQASARLDPSATERSDMLEQTVAYTC